MNMHFQQSKFLTSRSTGQLKLPVNSAICMEKLMLLLCMALLASTGWAQTETKLGIMTGGKAHVFPD